MQHIQHHTIILFYHYIDVPDPIAIMRWQKDLGARLGLTGRIIVATEGINGTVGGTPEAVAEYKTVLRDHPLFTGIDIKESTCTGVPFGSNKFKVLQRPEIVRLGIDPARVPFTRAAPRVSPAVAHELIATRGGSEDFVILDARNDYESRVGTFEGAVTPAIETFAQLPEYLSAHAQDFAGKDVLMFCTGGVRCERASAYLQDLGVARKVMHIEGGIDRYVQAYPEGYFKGHNYVFDGRVTVPVTADMLAACDHCGQPGRGMANCPYTRCNKRLVCCQACPETLTCSAACAQALEVFPERRRTMASVTACPMATSTGVRDGSAA